jgi:hypothetical protein
LCAPISVSSPSTTVLCLSSLEVRVLKGTASVSPYWQVASHAAAWKLWRSQERVCQQADHVVKVKSLTWRPGHPLAYCYK